MNPFDPRESAVTGRVVELASEEWHHKDVGVIRKENIMARKDTLLCKAYDREVPKNQVPLDEAYFRVHSNPVVILKLQDVTEVKENCPLVALLDLILHADEFAVELKLQVNSMVALSPLTMREYLRHCSWE